MSGRIQKQDVKTESELIGLGASASDLINDTQIYSSVLSKTLSAAIIDGDLSGGGGGGGGSFIWSQPDSGGPIESISLNGLKTFLFSNIESQSVWASIKVPSSYAPGDQIFLSGLGSFAASSGNVLMKTRTYLFKDGDTMSLGTPHTSTTVQQALGVNVLKVIPDLQLTDAVGEVNSIAVAVGDYLLIELFRDVSSETGGVSDDVSVLMFSSEVKFGA